VTHEITRREFLITASCSLMPRVAGAAHGQSSSSWRAAVTDVLRPHVKVNDAMGSSWALGWQVQKTGVINHGGHNPAFSATPWRQPRLDPVSWS
jgi:hypothetical protein